MQKFEWIGLALVVLGIVGLIYAGVTDSTDGGVVHMGSIQLNVEGQGWMPLSPVGAVMAALLGGLLVIGDRRRRRTRT